MPRILLIVTGLLWVAVDFASAAITFTADRPTRGHQIHQTVDVRTTANVVYEQSQQVIFDEDRDESNQQRRQIVVLEPGPELPARVSITYAKAMTKQMGQLGRRAQPQPVAGKTYLVERVEDGKLRITYPNGSQPARDEWAIVAANMRSLGKTNPLAELLDGRTVQVGERLTLPPRIAKELLGESLRFQEADQVTLHLQAERKYRGQRCGWFDLEIQTQPRTAGGDSLSCRGQITLSASTCRTLHMEVDAAFNLTQERGPAGATFLVHHRGTARIEMDARHNPPGSHSFQLFPVSWPKKQDGGRKIRGTVGR